MWPQFEGERWSIVIDQLADEHWVVIDGALPHSTLELCISEFNKQEREGELHKAAIGSFESEARVDNIRTDWIYWLDRARDAHLEPFFSGIDQLREALARELFLSLNGYEFHFAKYPIGAFYKPHLDQFSHRDNRMISSVLYLNEDWQTGDGGELRISKPTQAVVQPIFNRLVLFRSDTVLHEVLPAHKPRRSLTGWLLKQPSNIGIFGI